MQDPEQGEMRKNKSHFYQRRHEGKRACGNVTPLVFPSADSGILKSGLTVRRQKKKIGFSTVFEKSVGVLVAPKDRESEATGSFPEKTNRKIPKRLLRSVINLHPPANIS